MNFGEAFYFWLAKMAVEVVMVLSLVGMTIVGVAIVVTVMQLYTILRKRWK